MTNEFIEEDLLKCHSWSFESGSWRRSVKIHNENFIYEFPASISRDLDGWKFKAAYSRSGIRSNHLELCSFSSTDFHSGYSKMTAKIRKFAKNIGLDASQIYEFNLR